MTTVKKFEDLEIWKESKDLSIQIYKQFGSIKDFGFRDQICRASVSVMNNIAEGFERHSDKEFKRFLAISKGSSGEVRSMLWLAIELEIIEKKNGSQLIENYTVLSSKIAKLMQYLSKV